MLASAEPNNGLYLDLLKRCLTGYIYPESSYQEIYATPGLHPRVAFRRVAANFLRARGYKLYKTTAFDASTRERGADWPSIGYSMVGLKRLDNLQACVETVLLEQVPGDLVETGIWRGGACILMRAVLKVHGIIDRTVWGADSFQGLPAPSMKADSGYDLSEHPYLAVPLSDVEENFRRFGLLDNQVRFLKGWFRDTLPSAPIQRIAVLRLDGDLYESSMDALTALYDRVSAKGYIIVDDYHSWPACEQAIDDFRASRGITDPIQEIDGKGVFWRKTEQSKDPD